METEKKKLALKMPHPYVIIVVLLFVVSLMTYVIPAGEYDRYKNDAGITVVSPDSYHGVDQTPVSPLTIPSCILEGLSSQGSTIFATMVIGGALEIILATGMFHAYCKKIAYYCAGKQRIFIPVVTLIFTLIGLTQAPSRFLGFAPLGVILAATLGCDALTGVSMILLGIAGGFCGGMLASTTAIAQEIAELPAYSGMSLRVVITVLIYLSTTIYMVRYAERVRKDPTKSYLYGDKDVVTFELPKEEVVITVRHTLVLLVLVGTLTIMMWGCMRFKWGLTMVAVCFLWMGIIGGLLFGFSPSEISQHFTKGVAGMAMTSVIIGLGATVAVILDKGHILDTVVMSMANTINYFPQFLRGSVMLVVNTIVNFFIISGNGQAAAVMPVLTPVADLAGISRQTCVLAYKLGDGFSNYIFPHNDSLMAFIGIAGISYGKWMKFMGKLFAIWMLLGALVLVYASVSGY